MNERDEIPNEMPDCESCGEPTEREEVWQVGPGEWERFSVCEVCAAEAEAWNREQIESEFPSDEELERIIREEEALAMGDEF